MVSPGCAASAAAWIVSYSWLLPAVLLTQRTVASPQEDLPDATDKLTVRVTPLALALMSVESALAPAATVKVAEVAPWITVTPEGTVNDVLLEVI